MPRRKLLWLPRRTAAMLNNCYGKTCEVGSRSAPSIAGSYQILIAALHRGWNCSENRKDGNDEAGGIQDDPAFPASVRNAVWKQLVSRARCCTAHQKDFWVIKQSRRCTVTLFELLWLWYTVLQREHSLLITSPADPSKNDSSSHIPGAELAPRRRPDVRIQQLAYGFG